MPDPNPKLAGKAFEKPARGGHHVEVGRLEVEARRLNEASPRLHSATVFRS